MTVRKRVIVSFCCRVPAVAMALFFALSGGAGAEPVAMVTDIVGKASVLMAGKTRDVTLLTEVGAGSQLQLHAGTTLIALYLGAGIEYVFRGPALLTIRETAPEMASGAPPETRSPAIGKVVRVKPARLVQAVVLMRSLSDNSRIRLLNFDQTQALDRTIEFRWQGPAEGLTYQVKLVDESGQMLHQGAAPSTIYLVPSELTLQDGAAFQWTVSTVLSGARQTSTVGNFRVATSALRAQMEAIRPSAAAPVSERVAFATWLEQVELKDEARKVWRVLAVERPDDPQLQRLAQ